MSQLHGYGDCTPEDNAIPAQIAPADCESVATSTTRTIPPNRMTHWNDHGAELRRRGFPAIPITPPIEGDDTAGKAPGWLGEDGTAWRLKDWPAFAGLGTNEHPLNFIPKGHSSGLPIGVPAGVGICTGGPCRIIAVDIDVTDATHAEVIKAECLKQLGHTPYQRIGQKPKCLLVYRLAEGERTSKLAGAVEVLADDNQFVAYGWHKKTKQEYEWPQHSLTDAYADEVREVRLSTVQKFHAWTVDYCQTNGITANKAARGNKTLRTAREAATTVVTPDSDALARHILERLPNSYDERGDWLRIAAATFSACGAAGFDAFNEWSKKHPTYDERATQTTYQSFSKGTQASVGTLVFEARRSGVEIPHSLLAEFQSQKAVPLVAASVANPEVPATMTAERLRVVVFKSIYKHLARSLTFHHAKSYVPSISERALGYQNKTPRLIAAYGVGAGKTHATVRALKRFDRTHRLLADGKYNVLLVVKNHNNGRDYEKALTAAGLKTRRLMGAEKLCGNDDLKPQIKSLVRRAIPVQSVCETCPLFESCAYWKQAAPARGEVIIAQIAHVKAGAIPPLKNEDSAPVFTTIFDESPALELVRQMQMMLSELEKPIALPEPALEQGDDESVFDFATRSKNIMRRHETDTLLLDKWRGHIYASLSVAPIEPSGGTLSFGMPLRASFEACGAYGRGLPERGKFGFDMHFDDGLNKSSWTTPTTAEEAADFIGGPGIFVKMRHGTRCIEPAGIKYKFAGRMYSLARGQIKDKRAVSVRGRNAHSLRKLELLEQILRIVAKGEKCARDKHIKILLTDFRAKTGVKRKVSAYMVAELPKVIRSAPIAFLDATADEQILRDLAHDDDTPSEWTVDSGSAVRPFGTTKKITHAPVASSQLLRPTSSKRDVDAVAYGKKKSIINGRLLENGDIEQADTKAPIDFATLDVRHNAAKIARTVQQLVEGHKRKLGEAAKVFVVGPKRFVQGLAKLPWMTGVSILWHGKTAGSNKAKDCTLQISIGQNRPRIDELLATALAFAQLNPRRGDLALSGRFEWDSAPLYGRAELARVINHRDPFVNKILTQITDAGAEQSYGRARLPLRTAANPCELVAIDQIGSCSVVPTTWDSVEVWCETTPIDLFKGRHGRPPASADELWKLAPDLCSTARGARRAFAAYLAETKPGADAGFEVARTQLSHKSEAAADVYIGKHQSAAITYIYTSAAKGICETVCTSNHRKRGNQPKATPDLMLAIGAARATGVRSSRKLAETLAAAGHNVSKDTVARLLKQHPALLAGG